MSNITKTFNLFSKIKTEQRYFMGQIIHFVYFIIESKNISSCFGQIEKALRIHQLRLVRKIKTSCEESNSQ